jgi:hypothetical protein
MATGSILLPIGNATLPDGSASNAAPAIQRVKSSASAPSATFLQAAFDATTSEMCYWSFRMPGDYASAPVLKVQYKMASATSGTFGLLVRLAAVTDGDATDVDAKAFATVNTITAVTVPGTAGYLDEISSGTLTNADSLAANDFTVLMLARDTANDTATGDAEVIAVTLEYTTT